MSTPTTTQEFLALLRKSGLVPEDRLESYLHSRRTLWNKLTQPRDAATQLLADGLLSQFQAKQLLKGKFRGFWINKFLILEALGAGGMGQVLLCEQTPMSRLVAVKVLPGKKPGGLERFRREARAVAALDHPNMVRAIDIDQDERFHFLVMEHVDGINLQDLVDEHGRLEVGRACNYIAQAALGLQHAHEAGWVHRDMKPGNLLVDRSGGVKILDLGLARLTTDDKDNLTKQLDDNAIIGTADYLAPEQSLPDQVVDARADIYSLGITLYFLLTGKTPFGEGSVLQKIMAHQLKKPRPLSALRPGLPKELTALVERMMDKSPARRPQTAREIAPLLQALAEQDEYPLENGEYTEHCPRVRQLLHAARPKTPTPSSPEMKAPRQAAPSKRRLAPMVLAGGGVAALFFVIAAGGVGWWLFSRGPGTAGAALQPKGPAKDKVGKESKKDPPVVVPEILTVEEAQRHLDKICTVQLVVKSAAPSNSNAKLFFLNSHKSYRDKGNFTVVVQKLEAGQQTKDVQDRFLEKTIKVKGQVTQYNGQPQIVVPDLNAVEIISPDVSSKK
jgi:serine/threonine protein kinase